MDHDYTAIRRVLAGWGWREWPEGCHGIATREGVQDACGKPVAGLIDDRASEGGCYWAACTYHLHRWGRGNVVPLSAVLAALRGDA